MAEYLCSITEAKEIVLRIAPENVRSIRVAEKAGFTRVDLRQEAEGMRVLYTRRL